MIVSVEARSDVGTVAPQNEDMLLVGDEFVRDGSVSRSFKLDAQAGPLLLAVADGMGGAQAGEWASDIALARAANTVKGLLPDLTAEELQDVFETWARETHQTLLAEGERDASRRGMGTTVVGLLFYLGVAYRFHAGDSRLYRLRDGVLSRLTRDHSAREQFNDPTLPATQLVNALGGGPESYLEFAPLEGGLEPFDRYLLCSDGLHDPLRDESMAAALAADAATAANALVRMACVAGGRDNIGIVIADIGGSGE